MRRIIVGMSSDALELNEQHLSVLRSILSRFTSVEKAAIFGSRAMGKSRKGSDVDLVLYGPIDERTLGAIRSQIEETTLPFFCDVLLYNDICNEALLKHIGEFGRVIYEKH